MRVVDLGGIVRRQIDQVDHCKRSVGRAARRRDAERQRYGEQCEGESSECVHVVVLRFYFAAGQTSELAETGACPVYFAAVSIAG